MLSALKEEFNSYLETLYNEDEIDDIISYSLVNEGKRLRPLFFFALLLGYNLDPHDYFDIAASIEMIHTYSLIHDDLPAMDNDEYRRGRKTTHIVYGHAMGILAGDALLNYAFETAFRAFDMEENKGIPKALQVLAGKAGIYGMIGGQVVDVEAVGKPLERERLDFIYRLKTGALIEASMMIGAILAGASEKQVEQVRSAAADIGLAFQIQDDILDVTSTTEVLGKPVFSDEKNNKTTYVTFEGLEASAKDVEGLSKHAIETVNGFHGEKEFLVELIQYLIHREK